MRYVGRHRAPRPLLLRRPVIGGVAAAVLLAGPVLYATGNFSGAIQKGTPSDKVADAAQPISTPAGAETGTAGVLIPTDGAPAPTTSPTTGSTSGATGISLGNGAGIGVGVTTRPSTSTSTSTGKATSKPTKTTTKPATTKPPTVKPTTTKPADPEPEPTTVEPTVDPTTEEPPPTTDDAPGAADASPTAETDPVGDAVDDILAGLPTVP